VVPEIDMPAHANAAIVAMNYRYEMNPTADGKQKALLLLLPEILCGGNNHHLMVGVPYCDFHGTCRDFAVTVLGQLFITM